MRQLRGTGIETERVKYVAYTSPGGRIFEPRQCVIAYVELHPNYEKCIERMRWNIPQPHLLSEILELWKELIQTEKARQLLSCDREHWPPVAPDGGPDWLQLHMVAWLRHTQDVTPPASADTVLPALSPCSEQHPGWEESNYPQSYPSRSKRKDRKRKRSYTGS